MAQMVLSPECSLASSMPLRVSLVNLQKLTLWAWVAPASMRILAPAQNTRGLPERSRMTRASFAHASPPALDAPPLSPVWVFVVGWGGGGGGVLVGKFVPGPAVAHLA